MDVSAHPTHCMKIIYHNLSRPVVVNLQLLDRRACPEHMLLMQV
jgi:hypothetical protein